MSELIRASERCYIEMVMTYLMDDLMKRKDLDSFDETTLSFRIKKNRNTGIRTVCSSLMIADGEREIVARSDADEYLINVIGDAIGVSRKFGELIDEELKGQR